MNERFELDSCNNMLNCEAVTFFPRLSQRAALVVYSLSSEFRTAAFAQISPRSSIPHRLRLFYVHV